MTTKEQELEQLAKECARLEIKDDTRRLAGIIHPSEYKPGSHILSLLQSATAELRAEVERLREWYQAYAEGEGCEFKPSEWKALRDKALEQLATEREKNEALEKALRAYEKHT
jgi:hypothetical protein